MHVDSSAPSRPAAASAELHILFNGYVGERVASSVGFIREGDARIIVDPGMVPDRDRILGPLAALGESPEGITDVVLSHHHLDHTLHAALFPNARFHDFRAIYQGDRFQRRPAEGFALSPSVLLIETPGHTPQDLTTLVGTADGITAFTHLWWTATGPADDPYAPDPELLRANRARVLSIANRIVPGHGEPFVPDASTPR
jgi:glyoxylase-like metal-dependent hydrolase (beta-lactamase superfamily II)